MEKDKATFLMMVKNVFWFLLCFLFLVGLFLRAKLY